MTRRTERVSRLYITDNILSIKFKRDTCKPGRCHDYAFPHEHSRRNATGTGSISWCILDAVKITFALGKHSRLTLQTKATTNAEEKAHSVPGTHEVLKTHARLGTTAFKKANWEHSKVGQNGTLPYGRCCTDMSAEIGYVLAHCCHRRAPSSTRKT